MEDQELVHSHYWPGEGCIPVTPQARRLGWAFPVYVTDVVWGECITWSQKDNTRKRSSNPDKRIFDILESAWQGMGKALTKEPDRVMYPFKHWYWQRGRPKATKQRKLRLGARLLLDPETEEPWVLIFDPQEDGMEVLKHGEPRTDRGNEADTGAPGASDGADMDIGEEAV